MSYVGESPWWPIQSPNKGRKQKAKRRGIRSSLLILDLKDGRLQDSGKQDEGKRPHKIHVFGMNDDLWNRVCGLGCETWKGCELVELLVICCAVT